MNLGSDTAPATASATDLTGGLVYPNVALSGKYLHEVS